MLPNWAFVPCNLIMSVSVCYLYCSMRTHWIIHISSLKSFSIICRMLRLLHEARICSWLISSLHKPNWKSSSLWWKGIGRHAPLCKAVIGESFLVMSPWLSAYLKQSLGMQISTVPWYTLIPGILAEKCRWGKSMRGLCQADQSS